MLILPANNRVVTKITIISDQVQYWLNYDRSTGKKTLIGTIAPFIPFLRRSQTCPQMKSSCVFVWPNLIPNLRRQEFRLKGAEERSRQHNISKTKQKAKISK